MDQLAGRDSADGASVHYILKATAVCGKQCQILRKKDLDDTHRKCLCKNFHICYSKNSRYMRY